MYCVYNNSETLNELYNRTVKTLKDFDYRILFINDCSLTILKKLLKKFVER